MCRTGAEQEHVADGGAHSNASRSYTQAPMARSIMERPRGKRPVLFSRSANSVVLIAASMLLAGKPFLRISCSCSSTRCSTCSHSQSLGATTHQLA